MLDARVLVVDDEPDVRDLTARVLDAAGYEVCAVASGADALAALEREPWDLVLLDINMPGMDGWETLRRIRADEALTGLRVAMFTVRGEIGHKLTGLQQGADDYLTKPFPVDALLERVGDLLRDPR